MMAQPLPKPPRFASFVDFLEWERFQEMKHELIDGVPVAMSGGTEAHAIIQGNVFAALLGKLRGGPCRPFGPDMVVQTGVRNGRYPDVTIDCGQRNPVNRAAPKPVVVFEVLSPDTQGEDRTVKLWEYNELRSITTYVLVEQSKALLHVYSRGESGDFKLRPEEISDLDGAVPFPALGISLAMAEIYESLDFDAEPQAEAPAPTRSPWAH